MGQNQDRNVLDIFAVDIGIFLESIGFMIILFSDFDRSTEKLGETKKMK